MRTKGTVAARLMQKLVRGIAVLGKLDPPRLLRAASILPEQLLDSDGRMPHSALHTLWLESERILGDDTLGLRVAELSRRTPDNVLAYAVDSSPTVGEALRRGARYAALVHDAVEVKLLTDGDLTRVRLGFHYPIPTLRHGVEFTLGQLSLFLHQSAAGRFALREASFRHAPPRSREAHQRIFQTRLLFNATHDQLTFDRALLDLPLLRSDAELCQHLDRHLDLLLARARAPSDFAQRVRSLVGSDLRGGLPEIQSVAARLHMSPRSLQRRLRDTGSSFQAELNEVRRELAILYLGDRGLAIAEVAFLVGFSEVANFHRAFKRWTKMTPAECRRRNPSVPGSLSA